MIAYLNTFLFMILFLILFETFSSNDSCSSISNCLSCQGTTFSSESVKCEWENFECIQYYSNDESLKLWEQHFHLCLTEEDNTNQQILDSIVSKENRYNSNYPDLIEIPNGIGEGQYMEWKRDYFQNEDIRKKEVLFKIKFDSINKKDKLTFMFLFELKQKRFTVETFKDQSILASGIMGVEIYYYSSSYKTSSPFKIEIDDYEPPLKKVYIVIISLVGVLIFIGLIYVVIRLASKCINKRLNRTQYNIYEVRNNGIVPIGRINNQNANNLIIVQDSNNISGLFPISSNNVNQNDGQALKKKIKEQDMAPVNYKEDFNIFKDSCTICRDEFKEGVKVVVLSCKHIFHFDCVKEYLTQSNIKCPNCNKDLTKKDVNTKHNVDDINKDKGDAEQKI